MKNKLIIWINNKSTVNYIFLILLVLVLLPYLLISLYTNPILDDFVGANNVLKNGLFNAWKDMYNSCSGRYTADFFVVITPVSFADLSYYKLLPVIIILLTLGSTYYFLYTITHNVTGLLHLSISSLVFTLLYFYQMPSLFQGVYWYTSVANYQIGIIFLLFYFAFLYRFYMTNGKKTSHFILLLILYIITIGINEILFLISFTFQLYLLWKWYSKNKKIDMFLTTILCASLLFITISYFAKGNSIRAAHYPNQHQLVHSLLFTTAQMVRFLLEWLNSSVIFLITILYVFGFYNYVSYLPVFKNSFKLHISHIIIFILAVLFYSIFLPYWATGILGQHRTINIAYFFFIILWFALVTLLANRYEFIIRGLSSNTEIKKIKIIIAIALISMLFTQKNGYLVNSDLVSKRAYKYNEQLKKRYETLKNSHLMNEDICYLKKIDDLPLSIGLWDISEENDKWINKSYELFFGVNRVELKK